MATSLYEIRKSNSARTQEFRDHLTEKVEVLRDFRIITPRNEHDIVSLLCRCESTAQIDRVCRNLFQQSMFDDIVCD